MINENSLTLKTITDLLGQNFYIPEYQRGYRWTKDNVLQLLDDIWEYRQERTNRHTFYCLQPIVVRETEWNDIDGNPVRGYELIDGQQRLTTIHRILTFILLERYRKVNLIERGYPANLYSIYYKTRLESKRFLEQDGYDKSKPDLYYMSEAYRVIKEWFQDPRRGIPDDVMDEVRRTLLPYSGTGGNIADQDPEWSVQVIWYEIKDETQKSEDLFTRLNRGKIPLTSAELIKARFVNSDSFNGLSDQDKVRRRTLLVQLWDEIETQLNNPRFWAFVSNNPRDQYSTKIEYLFDIATKKSSLELDPLYSFIKFFQPKESTDSLWEKWLQIEEIYRTLLFWFNNKNFYHKVGYLIANGKSVLELVNLKQSCTKLEFEGKLDAMISQQIPPKWEDLRYDNGANKPKIIELLLLFNVELTRTNGNHYDYFPFEWYKNARQSLEHVHAQNIDAVSATRRAHWEQWLNAHLAALEHIAIDRTKADEVEEIVRAGIENMTYQDFEVWSQEILALIPREAGEEEEYHYLHAIENLALLEGSQNASLSNAIFEVKRQRVIEMDKAGAFIPIGTKRIYLKYYADETSHHYATWTRKEREKYLADITSVMQRYQPENTPSHAQ
jgi:hypothetical protein